MIDFVVEGKPVPAVRMTQRSKYADPAAKKYLTYKKLVAASAISAMNRKALEKIDGTVSVQIDIFYEVPKSYTKKRKTDIYESDYQIRPEVRGDIDNVAKSILDGMNGICFKDDIQVVELIVNKRFDDAAGVSVMVKSI